LEDSEIFKKHFAKAIGLDMIEEKVKVVQITLAKMISRVTKGEIRSCDKVRQFLETTTSSDVNQFLREHNELQFLDESKFTLTLKAVEED